MTKLLSHKQLTDTLGLSEYQDGFWLHDKTRGMNLAMREKTPKAAFIKALTYYQNRLGKVEHDYKSVMERVNAFVSQFTEDDDDQE